jgi:hypothetical protein
VSRDRHHLRIAGFGGSISRAVCGGAEPANRRIPRCNGRRDHRVEIELAGR